MPADKAYEILLLPLGENQPWRAVHNWDGAEYSAVNITPPLASIWAIPVDFLNDKLMPREQSCLELSKTWRREKEWGTCREEKVPKILVATCIFLADN